MNIHNPPPNRPEPRGEHLVLKLFNAVYKHLLVKPANVVRNLIGLQPAEVKPLQLFFIKKLLGFGAEGIVYLGEKNNQDIARKSGTNRNRTPEQRRRIAQWENDILRRLDHPNIIKVFSKDISEPVLDVKESDEPTEELNATPYHRIDTTQSTAGIQMEAAEGKIENFLPELNDRQRLVACQQLLDAVVYMHSKGVYNCDLKPENILWLKGQPKLSDFGSSCFFSAGKTPILKGYKTHTPRYTAPEVSALNIDEDWQGRSFKDGVDLSKSSAWSLAASFAEILYDDFLFTEKDMLTPITRTLLDPDQIDHAAVVQRFFKQHAGRYSPAVELVLIGLLHPDPAQRMSVEEAHEKMTEVLSSEQ